MDKFDVFISFKNTDSKGEFTRDREMAEQLYYALKEKNINAFYSNVSIAERGESHFGKMINEALEECDIFVAVGSSVENLKSQWVKYEIETFNNELLNGNKVLEKSAMYSFVTNDVRTNKLPMELRRCQSFTQLEPLVNSICKRINNQQEVKQSFAADKPADLSGDITMGTVIDNKYEIVNIIGRGGMSVVYLAIDKRLNKQWAVKVVRNDGKGNFKIMKESLAVEIEILRKLNSPYFPRIADVIDNVDSFVVVMDYIEGGSLGRLLREGGAQPERQVKEWALQLCDALRDLHTMRPPIIYRDLKPDNIMITPSGKVKLIDFGAAREYKTESGNSFADTTVLGTVGYAAPEQYGGIGQTDARTDIYGLGVTLYHALTNKNPSEPPYEILPIREINPNLSRAMEYIVKKCTNRDPSKRYQNVGQIITDLENMDALEKKLKDKPSLFGGFGAKKTKQTGLSMEEFDSILEALADPPIKPPKAPNNIKVQTEFAIPGQQPMNRGTVPVQPVRPVSVPPAVNNGSFFGETAPLPINPWGTPRDQKVKSYLIIAGMSDFTRKESAEIRFYLVTPDNKEDIKKALKLSPEYNNIAVTKSFEIGLSEKLKIDVMTYGLFVDKHDAVVSFSEPYDYIISVKSPYEVVSDKHASALFYIKHGSQIQTSIDLSFGPK